jgi:hypothetical protein
MKTGQLSAESSGRAVISSIMTAMKKRDSIPQRILVAAQLPKREYSETSQIFIIPKP